MSIFGKIMDAIFGHEAEEHAVPPPAVDTTAHPGGDTATATLQFVGSVRCLYEPES